MTITSDGYLVYTNTLAAETNINITANTITNTQDSVLFAQNQATITGNSSFINSGEIAAINLLIQGNQTAGTTSTITNNNILYANNILEINAVNSTVNNTSSLISRNNMIINANTLNNGSNDKAAYITAENSMQITANQTNNIGHDNQSLGYGSAYTIATVPVYNFASVNGAPQVQWYQTAVNQLTSVNSSITAGSNMTIQGNVLNQTGSIMAGTNLTIIGQCTKQHNTLYNNSACCRLAAKNLRL